MARFHLWKLGPGSRQHSFIGPKPRWKFDWKVYVPGRVRPKPNGLGHGSRGSAGQRAASAARPKRLQKRGRCKVRHMVPPRTHRPWKVHTASINTDAGG